MNAIVTGGAGFVGSHLVEYLLKKGDQVIVIDNFSSGRRENLPEDKNLRVINWDISRECDKTKEIQEEIEYADVVYHLAAKPLAIDSTPIQARLTYETNVTGTYNIVKSMNKNSKLVFVSTANVYSEGRKLWDNTPFNITSVYGYTKCIGERIVEVSKIPYSIFRPGTIVGTRGRCFPNRLVWCAVKSIPVTIFSDGRAYRDIIDVRDVARHFASAAHDYKGEINNLGTNREVLGVDLVNKVKDIANRRGYRLKAQYIRTKPETFVLQSTLVTNPKFKPRYTLNETLEELFDYYSKGGNEPPSWESAS